MLQRSALLKGSNEANLDTLDRGATALDSPADDLFRLLVESVPAAMIMTDGDGAIQFVNADTESMFGYADQELVGKSIDMLVPQRFRKNHEALRQHFFAHPIKRPMGVGRNLTAIRRDGREFQVEIGLAPIETASGRFALVVVLDASARKERENSSEARAAEGEARVQKLNADRLTIMGNMAIGVSHHINQPLSAIGAYLASARRLLKKKPELHPVGIKEVLDSAAEQVLRAGQIMSQLRGFLTHGESDKTLQSLHDLIGNACALTDAVAKNKSVRVTLQLNAEADRVVADRVQIQQALINLKCNALEAMQASERRELLISTSVIDGGMIRTDIMDTGPGLPRELRDNLFELFTTTKTQGLGLGLSISQSIVEAHHGRLWVESNPEGGTVFSFTLPLAGEKIEPPRDEGA
jgi:two-component system sensor kinase FixL